MNQNKLAYIISEKKIKNVLPFIEVCSTLTIDMLDKPCLIIGLNNAKTYIHNFNILQKQYGRNLYWTFLRTEKRVEYEKDINDFYQNILHTLNNDIKYHNIPLFRIKYNKIKNIINCIKYSDELKYFYIDDKTIYFTYKNNVFGISKNELEYLNISFNKVLTLIKNNNNNIIIDNIPYNIRTFLRNKTYLIPYIQLFL